MQVPTTFRDPAQTWGATGPNNAPITGEDTTGRWFFAGGGGGGGHNPTTYGRGGEYGIPQTGPFAGAGDGSYNGFNTAADAKINTGSGGGGGGQIASGQGGVGGGRGGSGIALIAYPE